MDSLIKLYLKRSENELILSNSIFEISNNKKLKKNILKIEEDLTFYSAVISHCYYSIFYSAKAYLLKNKIKTKVPQEHKKVFLEFKKLVESGKLDVELLNIYKTILTRAEELLGIFKIEQNKRVKYTYKKLSQSNKLPAEGSIANAEKFFKYINKILENDNWI